MLEPTAKMLQRARRDGYAVGAFNIYNMEGVLAVIRAAENQRSPVILQLLPSAVALGGRPLVALCLAAAADAEVEVSVQLDHCSDESTINMAMKSGVSSVMADGSHLPLPENIAFTRKIVENARILKVDVEAELGRISGEEDGVVLGAAEQMITQVDEAVRFVHETTVDALAVCIGNIHGKYATPPRLDFTRLADIATSVDVPLVLHGTSGLPDSMIEQSISLGVCKFNVNTEVRHRYLEQMNMLCLRPESHRLELVDFMEGCIEAMMEPVEEKIVLFGSNGKAEMTNR